MSKEAIFLLVSDTSDEHWYKILEEALSPLGPLQICKEQDILAVLQQSFTLIVVDAATISDVSYLVSRIRVCQPQARIIVATASPTWRQAREAFYAGAVDYIRKLSDKREILSTLQATLKKNALD